MKQRTTPPRTVQPRTLQPRLWAASVLSALLLGSALAQAVAPADASQVSPAPSAPVQPNSAQTSSAQAEPVPSSPGAQASSVQQGSAALPDSALAVRRILESRGLLGGPVPVPLPALRGLPISEEVLALLPHAVWGKATAQPGAAPAEEANPMTRPATEAGALAGLQAAPQSASAGASTDPKASTELPEEPAGEPADQSSPEPDVSTEMVTTETVTTAAVNMELPLTAPLPADAPLSAPAGAGAAEPTDSVPDASATGIAPAGPAPQFDAADAVDLSGAPSQTGEKPQQTSEEAQPSENILTALAADGRFGTFLNLAQLGKVEEAILSGPYTLLVPTDEAFAALDPAMLAAVQSDSRLAGYVLGYHVLPGSQTPGEATLTNVYGAQLPADLAVVGQAVSAGTSRAYALSRVVVPPELTEGGAPSPQDNPGAQ